MIVVDNDSQDGQLESFRHRFPWANFVVNAGNFGFASGNNLGARKATGRQLLFINPDVRAELPAVRELARVRQEHPELALLTAAQTDQNGRMQKAFDRFPDLLTYLRTVRGVLRRIAPVAYPDARRQREELLACDWISGSLVLIDRADFENLGGWSEDFWMYAEDMDLCRRAANRGMARACTLRCRFMHVHGGASRRDASTSLVTKTEVMISAHVYIQRHFRGLHRWLNHGIVALRNLLRLAIAAAANALTLGQVRSLRGRAKLFARLLGYYWSALTNKTWLSPRSPNYRGRSSAE